MDVNNVHTKQALERRKKLKRTNHRVSDLSINKKRQHQSCIYLMLLLVHTRISMTFYFFCINVSGITAAITSPFAQSVSFA